MSPIEEILKFTFGLVLNKAWNKVADKLKDGDVTVEKLRDVIIEDLNEVKTKIDGLSRKDLLSSCSWFKEGVLLLNRAVDESNTKSNCEENVAQSGAGETRTTATATTRSTTESGVLNEALELSNAIQKLNNTSSSRLVSAKELFKAAREEATRAFWNEALTVQDRIMAAKFRVASSILESLHDTKIAADSCTQFLKELHDLPAIGKIFSAYFKDEIKAQFYKDSRSEILKSVLSLNFAVSEFITRFSGELPNVRNWPKINFPTKGETIHPLVLAPDEIKEIFGREEIQLPQNYVRLPIKDLGLRLWGINSKGQLITTSSNPSSNASVHGTPSNIDFCLPCWEHCPYLLTFDSRSGRGEIFCQLPKATSNRLCSTQWTEALTIDRYDNVYVIIRFSNEESLRRNIFDYVLFVIDSRGYKQCESVLSFVEEAGVMNCVVTNERDIIIHCSGANHYYVCDSNGILKSCVPLERSASYDIPILECVTNRNEMIMRATKNGTNHVLVYTIEGKLKRQIEVAGSVVQVTYDYVTSQIQVLTITSFELSKNCCDIYCYPQTGDCCERLYLNKRQSQIIKRLTQPLVSPVAPTVMAGPGAVIAAVIGAVIEFARAAKGPLGSAPTPLHYPMLVSHPDGPTAHLWMRTEDVSLLTHRRSRGIYQVAK